MRTRLSLLSLCVGLFLLAVSPAATDFGGYRSFWQGFGANTVGGRGGITCAVNTLQDNSVGVAVGGTGNPTYRGSLRYCLEVRTEPRFVLPEVSGTITLLSEINITAPYVTLAGQTAPSPGLLVRNWGINVNAHDVVFQHVRIRPGTATNGCTVAVRFGGNPSSGFTGVNAVRVVLDHTSLSWGTATTASHIVNGTEDAIFDSILGEAIGSTPTGSPWNCGDPYGGATNIWYGSQNGTATLRGNAYIHPGHRAPWIGAGFRMAHYNNLVYDADGTGATGWPWHPVQITGGDTNYPAAYIEVVSVGNVYLAGPSTAAGTPVMSIGVSADQLAGTQIYLADNSRNATTGTSVSVPANQWDASAGSPMVWFPPSTTSVPRPGGNVATEANTKITSLPAWFMTFNITPTANVGTVIRDAILAHAGAWPNARDAVDTRLVADVTAGTGHGFITSQPSAYPTLASNSRAYTVPTNPNSAGSCGSTSAGVARTVIECDLETLALALEGSAPLPSVPAVTISTPSNLYETTSSTLTTLAGTSSTATGTITGCTWTNTIGGSGSGSTTGTTSWSVASITLTANVVNRITVTCTNSFSNSTSASIDVMYVPAPVTVTDTFTRSDWTTLGPSWTAQLTTRASIVGGQASIASNAEAGERFSAVAAPNNQCMQATIKSVSASRMVGVKVRASGSGGTRSEYVLYTDGTQGYLAKVINNTATSLGTVASPYVGNDVIKLCVVSQSLQAYRNDVAVGAAVTVTSSTLSSGQGGILLSGTGAALDDFSGSTSADITPPTIAISAPSNTGSYTAQATPLTTLAGTAADNIAVSSVTWVNSAGGSGTATGTATWSVASISLTAGTNNITVTAHDAAGNTTPTIISVTYIPPTPVTPPIVTITSFNTNYETGSSTLTSLAGTAFSSGGTITGCTWANTVGGSGSGSTTGTTSWTVPSITLTANVINRIIVTCVDNMAQTGSSQVDVLYVPPPSSAADNFNRTNWPTLGPNWTAATSAVAKVLSNQANGASTSSHYMIFTSWALTNDQCSQATIRGLTSSVVGTLIRANGSSSYLLATDGSSGAGHSYIGKVISGTITQLGALSTTYTTGDTVKLCVIGASLQAYKNGSAIGSPVVDSSLTTGYAGIYLAGTAAAVDDFIGSNTSGTVPNKLPIADPGGPYTGTHNVSLSVNASHSIAQRGVLKRYIWSWGDGTSDSSVRKPITTHTYTAAGTYTITLTVTDSRNQTSLPVSTTATVS